MLQVEISDSKSLVSDTGAVEFAKQFWVVKDPVYHVDVRKRASLHFKPLNFSPVYAKAVLAATTYSTYQQLAAKSYLSEKVIFKLQGAGFRVLGRLNLQFLGVG